jgi:hypothetical protein
MFLAPTTVDAAMMAVPVIITSVEFTEISSIRHRRQTLAGIAALSELSRILQQVQIERVRIPRSVALACLCRYARQPD